MSPTLVVVLLCERELEGVLPSLASIESAACSVEVVLVADDETPRAADDWLESLTRTGRRRFVRVAGVFPGKARNTALAGSDAAYALSLNSGDRLSRDYLDEAARVFERNAEARLVTSGTRWLYLDSAVDEGPGQLDLPSLASRFDAAHPATLFRLADWREHGGFDQELAGFDDVDLWIRILERGGCGVVLPDMPLLRPVGTNRRYRKHLEPDRNTQAVQRLTGKHPRLFARHVVEALDGRERRLLAVGGPYRSQLKRRDEGMAELARLDAQIVEARRSGLFANDGLGHSRRITPVSRDWGYERGMPVDRYYIEQFLQRHADDVRGVVLEVQEPDYTQRFGGSRVTRSEVLDLNAANERATVIADLRDAGNLRSNQFDCIILTQTVHVIDDMDAVVSECARLLVPGGVLLATLPCVSRVCLEYGRDGDHWRVTEAGARALFERAFAASALEVRGLGNALVTTAFTYGLALHELSSDELEFYDPYNPTLVTVRAVKRSRAARSHSPRGFDRAETTGGGAVLLYHRVTSAPNDPHRLAVTPDEFRTQMMALRRDFIPVPLEDLLAAARANQLPPRAVAVTFDDGYLDNLLEASPILLELGIPATFFVTTAALGSPFEYWWDTLARAILGSGTRPAYLELTTSSDSARYQTGSIDERTDAHARLYRMLLPLDVSVRAGIIERLVRWADVPPVDPANRRMNALELQELAGRPGHSIGAHTEHHLLLTAHDADRVRDDIARSCQALREVLGTGVEMLAYPFGAYDGRVARCARDAGVRLALTCERGAVSCDVDPLAVPRYEASQAGLPMALLADDDR